MKSTTYVPSSRKRLEIHKSLGDTFILQDGLVLVQKPGTYLCIFRTGHGVSVVVSFQSIERDDYAVDLS